MKSGVVLAGGMGSRLMPLTKSTNKHLLPVYNKPMIYHSIDVLKNMGCEDVIIVTGGEHIGHIAESVEDGSHLGVSVSYRVQKEADGIAGAIGCIEGYIGGLFPVILGDNYFYSTPEIIEEPAIYIKNMYGARDFGVYFESKNQIVEKPNNAYGDVVLGLYVYDDKVFDYIKLLSKSDRGEFEVTDINNMYLSDGDMYIASYKDEWFDMGSFEGLYQANVLARERGEN